MLATRVFTRPHRAVPHGPSKTPSTDLEFHQPSMASQSQPRSTEQTRWLCTKLCKVWQCLRLPDYPILVAMQSYTFAGGVLKGSGCRLRHISGPDQPHVGSVRYRKAHHVNVPGISPSACSPAFKPHDRHSSVAPPQRDLRFNRRALQPLSRPPHHSDDEYIVKRG